MQYIYLPEISGSGIKKGTKCRAQGTREKKKEKKFDY
jgi:hypothetical protein